MKKIFSIMLVVLLLSVSLSLALPGKLRVHKLRFLDEYVAVGDELVAIINLENDDLPKLKNLKVTVLIPDLGVRRSIGSIDLSRNKKVAKRIHLDVPSDSETGWHIARITTSNDDVKRVKHRFVYVGPKIVYV